MATYSAVAVKAFSDNLADHQAWAQSFGGGFTTAGWVAQTGHGEVVASGTGATYAWTNTGSVLLLPTTMITPITNYRFNGAWVSGNTYVGGNAFNGAGPYDLVTFHTGGNTDITYVHVTATSSLTTNPATDTTNWQPFIYEIWKTGSSSNSTSNPIYVRIVYTVNGTSLAVAGGSTGPAIHLGIGSGIDSNGNLTGAINTAGVAPLTNGFVTVAATGTNSTGDMDFSGDLDNIRWVTWRGLATAGYQWVVCIDRAKTGSGADSDAFSYVGMLLDNAPTFGSGTQRIFNSILLKPTLGSPINQTATGTAPMAGLVSNGLTTGNMTQFGATPPLPIFPLIGYVSNPVLGLVGFSNGDVNDGQIMPVWMYGAAHNFLVSKAVPATAANNLTGITNTVAPAIGWE
jgi:hypothetical protein